MFEFDVALVQKFLLALAIGALVGIEREKHKSAGQHSGFAGLRTFILLAQLGAISAWLSLFLQSPAVFISTVLAVSAIVLASYVFKQRLLNSSSITEHDVTLNQVSMHQLPGNDSARVAHGELASSRLGLTSEFSAITVCLLGGAVMFGFAELAVALAILTSAVLTFKQPLHGLVSKIDSTDLYAGLKLLLATFIVLPLLPDRAIDPWQALNPFKLWLLVILISGLSLLGYLAVRLLGQARGTAVAGLTGGLVSSTAVSLSFAKQSKQEPDRQAGDMFAAGILLAWLVMVLRVLAMVALLYLPLFATLWLPLGVMGVVTAIFAGYFYWQGSNRTPLQQRQVPLTNPFSLWAASQFALLFAAILLAVKLTEHYASSQGLYILAAIAGATDVDAITLSMTEFARQNDFMLASGAIAIAALSNTLVKCGMVVLTGSRPLRQRLLLATAGIMASGALAMWLR